MAFLYSSVKAVIFPVCFLPSAVNSTLFPASNSSLPASLFAAFLISLTVLYLPSASFLIKLSGLGLNSNSLPRMVYRPLAPFLTSTSLPLMSRRSYSISPNILDVAILLVASIFSLSGVRSGSTFANANSAAVGKISLRLLPTSKAVFKGMLI